MTALNTDIELLELILRELKEAVIVCDRNVRILLYNSEAGSLFRNEPALGLGRSLYDVCAREPVEHSLRILKHRALDKAGPGQPAINDRFVCATVDGTTLLSCRINKIAADAGRDCIFVFTFEDITTRIEELGRQGHLFENLIKSFRAPLTNLHAAAESLKDFPDMAPGMRAQFENIIIRESEELTRRFESIVRESGKTSGMQWPLSDVYSADLIGCVARRLREEEGLQVTMTGVPLWLHADSYLLMMVLDSLVRSVHKYCDTSEIDIEALLGDRRVYIDIVWQGGPIPQAEVDRMLAMSLPDSQAGMTVADVMERHDSEIWSQEHRRQGYAVLRIPVPDSAKQWEPVAPPLPARPEFYDFSIAGGMKELGDLAARRLATLDYIVFDTETTGLNPAGGDEILAIAAVRIVNGRILSGERFERLVKPSHPVPESSLPFLDITEEMLREEPPIEEVLPHFRSFVHDAVLVAHNAAFDMRFFRLLQEKTGIKFDNPVLDTLLLSILADKDSTDYTLENISRRLEIKAAASHTPMDECFITAQVFLRLLDMLDARGISTLGELVNASERIATEKKQQFA